ncbi:MAG: RNA polymerase factor sigma-54 [Proteobacteria bacterium]|nr:RNA polymerase factor sigma-54 [Pseudomonadota bacterium]
MKQALNIRQGQRLQLSTQLQHAIRLLQLSFEEVSQEISSVLESNPLLEEVEPGALPEGESETDAKRILEPLTESPQTEQTHAIDDDWRDASFVDRHWEHAGFSSSEPDDLGEPRQDHDLLWQSQQDSLARLLLEGLALHRLSDKDKLIAQTLIGCLDRKGYLTATYDDVRQILTPQVNADDDEIDSMLHLVQSLSDPGIGARDLAECLSLQLKAQPSQTSDLRLARKIVQEHFSLLSRRHYEALADVLEIDLSVLAEVLGLIQSLDPKPGERLAAPPTPAVAPDAVVHRRDDTWIVTLARQSAQNIRISNYYQQYLGGNDPTTRQYLKDHLREAQWFIRSLQQRDQTILSVATQIVLVQNGFMDKGDGAMVPLTLRDVAQVLGIHESTVSRAVDQKYLLTPHGLFPMKHFFSTGLGTSSGPQISARAAQARIRKMIESETSLTPISDGQLAAQLEKEGISIARRTVAKYREQMNIPPVAQRRSVI